MGLVKSRGGWFDYINILQDLLDVMVGSGCLPDDDAKHLICPPCIMRGISRTWELL